MSDPQSKSTVVHITNPTDLPGGTGTPAEVDLVAINGVAPAVGAGVVNPGTSRQTLASNDPAVVSLASIDAKATARDALLTLIQGVLTNWDETNRAAINPIVGE
ncbi:MAG: hypothetical protein KJ587_19600, partial [Alphaproteobacteria bacterium]|nr:hypothetical protein [Alphaproteobacteria bacterium]